MKKLPLLFITTLMASMAVQAAESTADMKVNPNAEYTYAETAECMNSIAIFGNVTGTLSKTIGNAATAMLGRLPACEIEKVILASGSKESIKLIQMRKLDISKRGQ